VAEFEREMLRTRVKAGLEMARRNGKRLGRPALRRFDADEISTIRQLRKKGSSVRSLALQYGTTQYAIAKMSDASA
jgi:DNA invertase Pin-like site-specific DNA recombinase